LRCLAHITRKARGVAESLDRDARGFGEQVLEVLDTLMEAVYRARGSPPSIPLREALAPMLAELFAACLKNADSRHAKTRALARELLNDWDTFWVVLDHPELPLTNNAAAKRVRIPPTSRRGRCAGFLGCRCDPIRAPNPSRRRGSVRDASYRSGPYCAPGCGDLCILSVFRLQRTRFRPVSRKPSRKKATAKAKPELAQLKAIERLLEQEDYQAAVRLTRALVKRRR
jgi:hypothetical protein